MQAGDVYQTYVDTTMLEMDFGYKPSVGLEQGIHEFARWYAEEMQELNDLNYKNMQKCYINMMLIDVVEM